MTEQPVETMTEQAFLGNADVGAVEFVPLPEIPLQAPPAATVTELPVTQALAAARQQYVPGAHLRRGPLWSPLDDVEVTALIRKSINANKLRAIAKAESLKAEDALRLALDVEEQAETAAHEADEALLAFTRKDTGL